MTEREEPELCANCGEPMDEYDDCLESEDGKHESQSARDQLLADLRAGRQASFDDLMQKFNKLRDLD